MFSISEIFNIAINLETNGEKFYKDALKTISDTSLADLMAELAKEEAEHKRWLSQKKNEVENRIEDPELEELAESLLEEMVGNQIFSLRETDVTTMEKPDDILKVAIEFERDTIIFYEMIKPFLNNLELSDSLDEIIEEENRHIMQLETRRLSL